jgi:outer membrane protein insertion porin family
MRFIPILSALILAALPSGMATQTTPVLSVEITGNKAFDSTQIKRQLRVSREGGWYHPDALENDLKNIERFYQDNGFLRSKAGPAAVEMKMSPGKGQGAVIRIPISEGPVYTLGELVVRNAKLLSTASLLQMAPVKPGEPYSRKKIQDWREKIAESYVSMGYIRFRAEVQENIHDVRRVIDCAVELSEGQEYRVGKIIIQGDPSINVLDFKKRLLVGEGGVYNPEMLSLSLHFINEMRAYRPLSQSAIEVRIDDTNHTVDLVFNVQPLKKSTSILQRGPDDVRKVL